VIAIAWQNLVHDRARLWISLVGVTFAVFLMLLQSGIYFGFVNSASSVIDNCPADLWIVSANTVNFESGWVFPEEEIASVKGTPGIRWVERIVHSFGYLKLPDGTGRWAQVVGFNPDTGIGGPWEMVAGSFADLKKPGSYIVDESSVAQLQGLGIGDRLENFENKMEVVGLCRGVKTYTTYPIVFTSWRTAQEQLPFFEGKVNFLVAGLEPGADRDDVVERLSRVERFDVYDAREFSALTRSYWATKTGIGVGIGLTIGLGFIVGLVIVGQTMYAATVERLREYATLKALGAANLQICTIIWVQSVLFGLGGYTVGGTLATLAKAGYSGEAVAVEFPPGLFAVMLAATLVMCLGAAMLSVLRVLRVDPATVFRA
jgi:putative ABC transport system permease protein